MTQSHLIPQRDDTLLVPPGERRDAIVSVLRLCAQLARVIAGGYIYQLSSVAMWGAAARGITASDVLTRLNAVSIAPLPAPMVKRIVEPFARWGVMQLHEADDHQVVRASDPTIFRGIGMEWAERASGTELALADAEVGTFKLAAARAGWPVLDLRVQMPPEGHGFRLADWVAPRAYQLEAADAIARARHGVVLLPCGAGKTIVGVIAASEQAATTLVLTPSRSVAEQWVSHFRSMTTLAPEDVGLFERDRAIRSVTVATYNMATVGTGFADLLDRTWGLVIYDEVQSLPADVFRNAAVFSASRRLGLTATLVREDGREREIMALIGPVIYDVPWSELAAQGWIAPATCVEIRTPGAENDIDARRFKIAVTERLIEMHRGEQIVVIGSQLPLLRAVAGRLGIELLTGSSTSMERSSSLDAFRQGKIDALAMSRIGSVGVDLPQASVLIQISGTFGSRQEEAQRLGRILRPAPGKTASFYSIVLDNPRDVRFAQRRQRFLVDQGYRYEIVPAAALPRVRSMAR